MKYLREFFESKVDVPRIRVGRSQTVETSINEEALLLAKFLRDEKKTWIPCVYLFALMVLHIWYLTGSSHARERYEFF